MIINELLQPISKVMRTTHFFSATGSCAHWLRVTVTVTLALSLKQKQYQRRSDSSSVQRGITRRKIGQIGPRQSITELTFQPTV
jgi:hypothetical protein